MSTNLLKVGKISVALKLVYLQECFHYWKHYYNDNSFLFNKELLGTTAFWLTKLDY